MGNGGENPVACLINVDAFCRNFVLLRLRHGVSEVALNGVAALMNELIHGVRSFVRQELSATEGPDLPRDGIVGLKRSLDQTVEGIQQVSTAYRRRRYIHRNVNTMVRVGMHPFCLTVKPSICSSFVL